jgi:hypothetical protein
LAQLMDAVSRPAAETSQMRRLASFVLTVGFACGACGQAPDTAGSSAATSSHSGPPAGAGSSGATSSQSAAPAGAGATATPGVAAGEFHFTITYGFDSRPLGDDLWVAGSFTTTGSLSRALIDGLTEVRGEVGLSWPSSGVQQYGDVKCSVPDQCVELCVGGLDSTWADSPALGVAERSGGRVVLDALLYPDPKPDEDRFLTAPACPPQLSGGRDGFPPMLITIDGLDGSAPVFSVAPNPFEGAEPEPGEVHELTITLLP